MARRFRGRPGSPGCGWPPEARDGPPRHSAFTIPPQGAGGRPTTERARRTVDEEGGSRTSAAPHQRTKPYPALSRVPWSVRRRLRLTQQRARDTNPHHRGPRPAYYPAGRNRGSGGRSTTCRWAAACDPRHTREEGSCRPRGAARGSRDPARGRQYSSGARADDKGPSPAIAGRLRWAATPDGPLTPASARRADRPPTRAPYDAVQPAPDRGRIR